MSAKHEASMERESHMTGLAQKPESAAEKFCQPPHNLVVKHVDYWVIRRDESTGALVYSTDFTNTHYHPSPAHIM